MRTIMRPITNKAINTLQCPIGQSIEQSLEQSLEQSISLQTNSGDTMVVSGLLENIFMLLNTLSQALGLLYREYDTP